MFWAIIGLVPSGSVLSHLEMCSISRLLFFSRCAPQFVRCRMQKLKKRWASKTCLPFGEPESAMQATQPYKSVSTFQTLRRWRLACLSCKSVFIHSSSSILPSPHRLPIAPSPASNQSFWDLLYAESISGLYALIEWKACPSTSGIPPRNRAMVQSCS